ncbi:hypothetical protein E2C01_065692 [Portunus trituberculatus]|uniref:Uncharacterized protein n=1 Tax=Portunus trituberculatus TaxID=210409 RepID=A0A5B7HP40_PORTR|nr:hypothetical protein [Portunus trituberculatus]
MIVPISGGNEGARRWRRRRSLEALVTTLANPTNHNPRRPKILGRDWRSARVPQAGATPVCANNTSPPGALIVTPPGGYEFLREQISRTD